MVSSYRLHIQKLIVRQIRVYLARAYQFFGFRVVITDSFIERTKVNYDTLPLHDYLVVLFTHLNEQRELGELLLSAGFIHYVKDEFDRIFSAKAKGRNELYSRCFCCRWFV